MTMTMTRVARVGLANPSYGAVRLKLWPQRSNLRTTFDRDSIMMIMMIMMMITMIMMLIIMMIIIMIMMTVDMMMILVWLQCSAVTGQQDNVCVLIQIQVTKSHFGQMDIFLKIANTQMLENAPKSDD